MIHLSTAESSTSSPKNIRDFVVSEVRSELVWRPDQVVTPQLWEEIIEKLHRCGDEEDEGEMLNVAGRLACFFPERKSQIPLTWEVVKKVLGQHRLVLEHPMPDPAVFYVIETLALAKSILPDKTAEFLANNPKIIAAAENFWETRLQDIKGRFPYICAANFLLATGRTLDVGPLMAKNGVLDEEIKRLQNDEKLALSEDNRFLEAIRLFKPEVGPLFKMTSDRQKLIEQAVAENERLGNFAQLETIYSFALLVANEVEVMPSGGLVFSWGSADGDRESERRGQPFPRKTF